MNLQAVNSDYDSQISSNTKLIQQYNTEIAEATAKMEQNRKIIINTKASLSGGDLNRNPAVLSAEKLIKMAQDTIANRQTKVQLYTQENQKLNNLKKSAAEFIKNCNKNGK